MLWLASTVIDLVVMMMMVIEMMEVTVQVVMVVIVKWYPVAIASQNLYLDVFYLLASAFQNMQ